MPKTSHPKQQTLTIRLPASLREQAERYAAARDMSVGEFIRYTIRFYVDQTPEAEEDY